MQNRAVIIAQPNTNRISEVLVPTFFNTAVFDSLAMFRRVLGTTQCAPGICRVAVCACAWRDSADGHLALTGAAQAVMLWS